MHSKAHYCFIFENGEQKGPFPPGKVQRMLRDGEITDAALVWREGLTDWQPIGSDLPRLATIRQKEYLKFLGHPTTRDIDVRGGAITTRCASSRQSCEEAGA